LSKKQKNLTFKSRLIVLVILLITILQVYDQFVLLILGGIRLYLPRDSSGSVHPNNKYFNMELFVINPIVEALMVAGFLYLILFQGMHQSRKNSSANSVDRDLNLLINTKEDLYDDGNIKSLKSFDHIAINKRDSEDVPDC
jgi:hypothetical protein